MAMTAPVRTATGESSTRVSFVLGKAYTRSTAPRPLDSAVKVRDVAEHYIAARTFSGPPPSEQRVARERERIEAALEANGLTPVTRGDDGETLVYGYHDPFITPNFLRRNEVCVRVRESSAI